MSKKKKVTKGKLSFQNPVAKHAHNFNRSVVFADKTRYTRKTKHKGLDPAPMTVDSAIIGTGFGVDNGLLNTCLGSFKVSLTK
ncbi:MAG: hypothetical protein V3V18_11810 [Methylococcales bacterium]